MILKVNPYAGINLISAKDKTPKRDRKGNYWVKFYCGARQQGTKLISIEKFNFIRAKVLL